MALTFTTVQDLKQAGIAILVKASTDVDNAVNCIFTDNKHSTASNSLDHTIISVEKMNADASGVMIYLSDTQYNKLTVGDTVVLTISTQDGTNGLVQKTLQGLEYKRAIPFSITSIVDGYETVHVTIQLNKTIYDQNSEAVDGYYPSVTLSQGGTVLENNCGVTYGAPTPTGEVTITIGNPGANTPLPTGQYEVGISVNNNIGAFHESVFVDVTSDPNTVEAVSFNTFDVCGGMFQLEYGAKDYSGYTTLKVYASFSQKDNLDVSGTIKVADICGVTFDAPVEWLMPESIKNVLTSLDVSGAYDTEKFEVQFWIEGNADTTDNDVDDSRPHIGAKTTSKYWLDKQLSAPTLSLDDINWISGVQIVQVVEAGSFNNYTVSYDLSGNKSNDTMDACGATVNSSAFKSYSYSDLEPVNGNYKELSVSVERPEINNLDAINPPMNKSTAATINWLKAIKSATAPVVTFTDITSSSDGSIEFALIEASANTELFGTLMAGESPIDSIIESIPASGTTVVTFEAVPPATLEAGIKYTMNAYSRFDLSNYDGRYKVLNGGLPHLLSAAISASKFFTLPPTMVLTVRPNASDELKIVRMTGDANANNIERLVVYAKDVDGQVLESKLTVGDDFADTCGNTILNTGGNVDNFNTSFIQDFEFATTISIDSSGGMFLLGIIDTPDEVDAILVDKEATAQVGAFNNAVIEYDAGVIKYDATLDASTNFATDYTYNAENDSFNAWTSSGEKLSQLLVDTCGTLLGAKSVDGSDLNVADLSSALALETLKRDAMVQTLDSMDSTIIQWNTDIPAANASETDKASHTNTELTHKVFSVSGEVIVEDASGVLSVPNFGHTSANLTVKYGDYATLVGIQGDLVTDATVLYDAAVVKKNELVATKNALIADDATPGSILYAADKVSTASSARASRKGDLVVAASIAYAALYGVGGTITVPTNGFLKTLNEKRTALGN